MHNINAILNQYLLTVLLLFISIPSYAYDYNQTPLDSVKQVWRTLKIPYEIQESWGENLEELEEDQDSPKFRILLMAVNEELEKYLVDKDNYRYSPTKKKRKLKDQLRKIGKNITGTVEKEVDYLKVIKLLGAARIQYDQKKYSDAIQLYKEASTLLVEQEKWKKWIETQLKIADILAINQKDYDAALHILPAVKEKMRVLGDGEGMRMVDTKMSNLQKNLEIITVKEAPTPILSNPRVPSTPGVTPTSTPPNPQPNIPEMSVIIKQREADVAKTQEAIASAKKEKEEIDRQLREAQRNNDKQKIEQLNQGIAALAKKQLQNEKAAEKAAKELAEQQLKLTNTEKELTQKRLDQQKLYGGLAVLGLLFFSVFFMYRSKQKDHKKLAVAYDELAVAQEELKEAEQKIKGLLNQQVSGAVAAELLAGNVATKQHERRFVCIMFLDIRDFTPFVESKTPEEIIDYQNKVLGFMMEKVIDHGGIVNTVLGDGFMATFGAPVSAGNDCLQAYKAAVEIMQMVRAKSKSGEIPTTKIGIGMHAGSVVAGNVGTKTRKQYVISGNTVIIASRLEQLNKEYGSTLVLSKEVIEQLPTAMNLPTTFDSVKVKGRTKPVEIAKYG